VKGGDQGARLPQVASNQAAWTTATPATSERQADERVQAIIAANQSTSRAVSTVRASSASSADGQSRASRLVVNMPLPGAARRLH